MLRVTTTMYSIIFCDNYFTHVTPLKSPDNPVVSDLSSAYFTDESTDIRGVKQFAGTDK